MSSPAGWYPDPLDSTKMRYWDGTNWSDQQQPLADVAPPSPLAPENPMSESTGTVPESSDTLPQPPTATPTSAVGKTSTSEQSNSVADDGNQVVVPQVPASAGNNVFMAPAPSPEVGTDQATTVLVLGITSIVLALTCTFPGMVAGILAIVFGMKAQKESRQTGLPLNGTVKTGLILGIVGTVLSLLMTGLVVLFGLVGAFSE